MFAIERDSENGTMFEVFVAIGDTCNVYSNDPYPASEIADEITRRMDIMECIGYEKVAIGSDSSVYVKDYYIFKCVCKEPCTLYTMRSYVNGIIDRLIHIL